MTLPVEHPAVVVFKSFFSAMNAWGAEMIEHAQSLRGGPVDLAKLNFDRMAQRQKL